MAKTALITGTSSGIGAATARAFREDEWEVWATARDEDDLDELADLGCRTASLDVTDPAACERVVERAVATSGRIDCLVNNAGIGQYGPLEDVDAPALQYQLDVNVVGPHRLTRELLPHMREHRDGTIVNVSSVMGRIAVPGMGAYAGSKWALEAMSETLADELEPLDVDVVLVEPGPVETSFSDKTTATLPADRTRAYDWVYEFQSDRDAALSGTFSVPPRSVALTILDAANASNPSMRYPVGQFARWAVRARHLPRGLRSLALRGLRKLG